MPTINPYINFPGNTEEAFLFYQTIFGGEFPGGIRRYKDMPGADHLSPEEKEKVMHMSLPIGKENFLMGTDSLESLGQTYQAGNNHFLSLAVETREETKRIFTGLSEGGTIVMPLQLTHWGAYFGMCNDKFGVQWMVNCENASLE